MTVSPGALDDLATVASYLALPGLGAILLALGGWRLSRGLRGLGSYDGRYDIRLHNRRTRDGRHVVLHGDGAAMIIVGVTLLGGSAMTALQALIA